MTRVPQRRGGGRPQRHGIDGFAGFQAQDRQTNRVTRSAGHRAGSDVDELAPENA